MASKRSVKAVLDDAEKIINTWLENPTFAVGELQRTQLETLRQDVVSKDAEIERLRTQITGLIDSRDQSVDLLASYNTRSRSGFRAVYGADSTQYKQAGGTPTSERKSPRRKPKSSGS